MAWSSWSLPVAGKWSVFVSGTSAAGGWWAELWNGPGVELGCETAHAEGKGVKPFLLGGTLEREFLYS